MKTNIFSGRRYAPAFFSLFILLFSFVSTAYSTVYYISTTGNDVTGKGTVASPWKTLYKATSAVTTAGDIIHVYNGIYVETQQCLLAVGVSIEGDNKFNTIIRSTITVDFTPIIRAESPEGTNGNQHISNVRFEGQMTTKWCILISGRSNFSIYDCRFYDFFDVGVSFKGKADFLDGPPATYSFNNSFYNNYMFNCAHSTGEYGRGNLQVGGQTNMQIYNDTIIQAGRPAGQNGYCIKNINQGFLRGMKIHDNYLEVPRFPYPQNGYNSHWDFATEFSDVSGLEVYNNRILGSCDQNFQYKGTYPYSVYYHDNIFGRDSVLYNPESGIILEYGTETAIMDKNTFKNVAFPIKFSPRDNNILSGITISRNLMYGVGITNTSNALSSQTQGVKIEAPGYFNYSIQRWKAFNNTVIAYAGNYGDFGFDVPSSTNGPTDTVKAINNIIRGFRYADAHVVGQNNTQVLYLQNNNTGSSITIGGGTPPVLLNSGNTTIAPNLNSTTYVPNAGSPMIDAGLNVGLIFAGAAPERGFAELNLALPVKLIDFTVTENKGINFLRWKTATESNSDYFTIERSSNGITYESIGRVNATGFSSNVISYNFTDANPLKGINYYRLVMVDKDNSFEHSNIVSITNKTNQGISIINAQLYSGKQMVAMSVSSSQNQKANLVILDQNGRIFLNEITQLQKGLNSISKSIPAIASGIYYLKLFTTDETIVKNVFAID